MAKGVNKVILIGCLGQDVETRYTSDGKAMTNLSVATSESWKDQQGQKQEKTEWHRVVMFGKLAEIANQYLTKGSQVYLEGKLQTRKWQTQSGQERYSTEVIADQMQMLGGKQQGQQSQQQQQPAQQQKPQQNAYAQQKGQARPQQQQQGGYGTNTDDGWSDSDIPF